MTKKSNNNFLGKVSELFVPSGFDNFTTAAGLYNMQNSKKKHRKHRGGSENIMSEEMQPVAEIQHKMEPKMDHKALEPKTQALDKIMEPNLKVEAKAETNPNDQMMSGGKNKKKHSSRKKHRGGAEDGHMTLEEMKQWEAEMNYELGPLSGGGKKKKKSKKSKKGGFSLFGSDPAPAKTNNTANVKPKSPNNTGANQPVTNSTNNSGVNKPKNSNNSGSNSNTVNTLNALIPNEKPVNVKTNTRKNNNTGNASAMPEMNLGKNSLIGNIFSMGNTPSSNKKQGNNS